MPLHLIGDVGRSLRPIHARPPPLLEGCVSVGGGGGRTRLGSCRGGVRETRRREEEEGNDNNDAGNHSQSNATVGQRQRAGANNRESNLTRCIAKWVYTTHFTSFSLFNLTHTLRPDPPAMTSSTLLHHAPRLSVPIPTPNGPNFKIRRHLKWSLLAHHPHDVLHGVVATAPHSPPPPSPCYRSYNNLSPLPLQPPWPAASIAIDTAPSNAVNPAIPTFLTTRIFLCKLFLGQIFVLTYLLNSPFGQILVCSWIYDAISIE